MFIILKLFICKYGTGRQSFSSGEAGYILRIHQTGHHLEPSMQSRVAKEKTFPLHLEVKVATDMMDIISTFPRFIRNSIYHLLCRQIYLWRLSDNKDPCSLLDVLGIYLNAGLHQSTVLRVNIQRPTIKRRPDTPLLLKINHIDATVIYECNVTGGIHIRIIFRINRQKIRQVFHYIQLQTSLDTGPDLSNQTVCTLPVINLTHL